MDRSMGDRTIRDGRLYGIEGRPPTPDSKAQPLNPRRELAACFHAYKKTYIEIEELVRRMTSLKIYSCDEYEVYSGSNGFLIDWLDWDKISLALHSVELEVRRMDILHWVAIRQRNPLPAEVLAMVQNKVLDWKNAVHLTPFEKVDDKHGLKTLIATSGLAISSAEHDAISEQSKPYPSLAPTTEVSESMQADYSQAINYISAPNSEDERYQDEASRQPSLEIDEKGDVSPNGPNLIPFTEHGETTSVNKPAFPKKRQRSETVSDGFTRRRKGRRRKSDSWTTVSVS
ncbi:hypothetical protein N7G274_008889 [Stereocaulon virgatum]|uniref:Uncharacterized protein n=1 Tax=Stereocaulon virgatum TaxID=373712 RepID=A0ABR3ZXA2_9LECA